MLNQHKQGFYEKRVDNHCFSFFPKEDKSKSKAKGKRKTEKEKPPRRMGGVAFCMWLCVCCLWFFEENVGEDFGEGKKIKKLYDCTIYYLSLRHEKKNKYIRRVF